MSLRPLLAVASIVAIAGSVVHTVFFGPADAAIASSGLSAFYAACYKGLWTADSGTLGVLGVVLGYFAYRPAMVTRRSLLIIAVVLGTQVLCTSIYVRDLGTVVVGTVTLLTLAAAAVPPISTQRLESD